MRRLIAGFLLAVLITGCSQKAAFEELADGPCTSAQGDLVNQHISGQINALAKQDWKLAYSFASANFRGIVPLDEFTFIIAAQYPMLVENQGYTFDKCTLIDSGIVQEVRVTSEDQVSNITYVLSVSESALGIESAVIGEAETGLST
jgi:hypothetical protein